MEDSRSKRTLEPNREKFKKNVQEKKTKSDTTALSSCSSVADLSLDSFIIVGKGCSFVKSKQNDFRLHECYSETAINPHNDFSKTLKEVLPCERLQTVPSNSSFTSAKSDFSDAYQKQIHDLEENFLKQNLDINSMKRQLGGKDFLGSRSVSTETDVIILVGPEEHRSKLKELEKKISSRERKIKDLSHKLEECSKAKEAKVQENRSLGHKVSLLHRQLQSMFEYLGKNWNPADPAEVLKSRSRAAELESLVAAHNEEKKQLSEAVELLTLKLENKEKEIGLKTRELVEYKNKSTLEMCKLINQIDSLQKEAKNQSDIIESKISEAQSSMEDEIVTITLKLEDQYQKDVKSAIEKFHADFTRLADLPRVAIDQLLKLCEPGKIDIISYQKEWDRQQSALEAKIESLQAEHSKNILQLKDTYESKILFLKTQVETLSTQLKERKEIIDIFESELMLYKSNSSMNLLKASSITDDISALKELYTAEIFSQKQIHKLHLNIFDERVKAMTDEILYFAKSEEIRAVELENAKKMALAFREKYEELVRDWEDRAEREFRICSPEAVAPQEFDSMVGEFMGLIQLLKKTEEAHEEKIKALEARTECEKVALMQEIEDFKVKLENLIEFQKMQENLDGNIQHLIKTIGRNYTEAVDTVTRSHVTELNYKQMETYATEKRHIEEIDELKNRHEKEVEDLQNRVDYLENVRAVIEKELDQLTKSKSENTNEDAVELRKKFEVMMTKFMKAEGIIAAKEEAEKAMVERIRELEDSLKLKEENCRKELESLKAELLKEKVMASAKDDLSRELEDKLNKYQDLLEKSCEDVDQVTQFYASMSGKDEDFHMDGKDFDVSSKVGEKVQEMKEASGRLKTKLMETLEEMEGLKLRSTNEEQKARAELKLIMEKNAVLEEEKNQIASENNERKKQIRSLEESLCSKEMLVAEMESRLEELKRRAEKLETEREEIRRREEEAKQEKEKILEKNAALEATVKELTEQIEQGQDGEDKTWEEKEELVSISLEEIRFLYEEEIEETTTVITVSCQTHPQGDGQGGEVQEWQAALLNEGIYNQLKDIQKELTEITKERDELTRVLEKVENERDQLRAEAASLQEENRWIRARHDAVMLTLPERESEAGMSEVNKEIGKLSSYVKTLSDKLDVMKASNDLLLTESQEHFRQNQNLVNELEEAWSHRYEIEDQLAKMRRENAMLNLHKKQLEETNKRITSLVTEGKPSVVTWIKIHETVENIVEEVLALKTSIVDPEGSEGVDSSRTDALKAAAGSFRAQLTNKTLLCDELVVQTNSLERVLKNFEKMLQTDYPRNLSGHCRVPEETCNSRKRHLEFPSRQPAACSSEKRQTLSCNIHSPEASEIWKCSRTITPGECKTTLEDEVEMEGMQFSENLDPQPKMQKTDPVEKNAPLDDDGECLKAIEVKYEEEVAELSKEFEKEVEKLRMAFGSEKEDDYTKEIDKLKDYFQKKWKDLERRYTDVHNAQKRVNFNSTPGLNHILEQFLAILREEDGEEKKMSRIKDLLKEILNRCDEEVKSLRQQYQEALDMLTSKHDFEVQQLQAVVLQLRENIMTALNAAGGEQNGDLFEGIQREYEAKLEEEKRRFCDLLENAKQKHEKEVADLEEFWTEKLSECETKCALVKATGSSKNRAEGETESDQSVSDKSKIEQSLSERGIRPARDNQTAKHKENIQNLGVEESSPRHSLCVSCIAKESFLERMELKTDDDKLDVIQQREALEEMVYSMRNIVSKLLTFMGHQNLDLNSTVFGIDETLYKTIRLDPDRSLLDANGTVTGLELSTIIQEIKDNSLLSSSDQVRFELDRCLKQLTKDATSLLALSCPENNVRNLSEMIKRVEREKNELEAKVCRVEETQNEMKEEISTTKERLAQWERNLEVVSEGYGEEIVEPKQTIPLSDVNEKLKTFLIENCVHSQQDLNLMEEICKEGDRLQEEWLKEKCDLQQQIDVADKQLHSLKKFLEEQALEREQEREAFDREINKLQENLKAKERDNSLQNRTNREVEALASQVKDLAARLTETEKNKSAVEEEFQNAVKKIWSLREVIQDLEVQLAEVSERENNLKKKVEKTEGLIEEYAKANRQFKEELEACRNQNEMKYSEHVKGLEEELMRLRHVGDQVSPESLNQLKTSIREIEAILIKKTKDLEQLHVSSANVSCSSPSEDVSIRDHLDATRCSTPDEMSMNCQTLGAIVPMEEIDRVHEKLSRHTRAEEVAIKYIQDLKMQLRNHRKAYEEIQTERDVLLDKVDVYLKENSSLKVRLEEQRCNAGLLQKQLNANLESQINRLEVDVEKLNEMCHEKDKQLKEMKMTLENTTKTLKVKESEAVNKSREVNTLITTLKTDLANALSEKEKLEEKLENTLEKLRDTMKMPALVESIIDEKNAEIDRLEKEVARLSCEKSSSGTRSFGSEEKHKRKIRFPEPESFSQNISSISPQYPSDLRNCSESFGDFRSSFKGRRPVGCSTKLESNSSIAPLQLSPRGGDSFTWKTSSPIITEPVNTTPPKTTPTKTDFEQMEEVSKLQGVIDSKQREISELHLEIDILKRQLVEVGQEVATAKSRTKEVQNDLSMKDEEIQKLKNQEKSLLASLEALKAKHGEEVEVLENKLTFERGKVEKVYEEIKTLENRKIEIEEAFLNLKEDYSEKIEGEKRATEALLQKMEMLEARNDEYELKSSALEKELENVIKESEKTIQVLTEEMEYLRKENGKKSGQKENAATQVEDEVCVCQHGLTLEMPQIEACSAPFREDLDELKAEFEKLVAVLRERDFSKREAFSYAMAVRRLFSVLLGRLGELTKEVEEHMKKVKEYSVDDLAVKVQRELVLSAKLDHQLLSSIRANGLVSKEATPQPDSLPIEEPPVAETGGGDHHFVVPNQRDNSLSAKVTHFYEVVMPQLKAMGQAKDTLQGIILEQKKMIRALEEDLKREKGRIFEEKERCKEDAKLMELLRVNLEKALGDLKAKDRELKREKQKRMALEKENENCMKQGAKDWEGKKIQELTAQLEAHKEKFVSMGQTLEEERRKTQEAKLALEECQIERMSGKAEQKLLENDLEVVREQKENYKKEILDLRKLLHARNMEIGLLKRKINLLEIDIKALTLSDRCYPRNPSDTSSIASNVGCFPDFGFNPTDLTTSLLCQKKLLNANVQGRLHESETADSLLRLGQEEPEQIKDYMRMLEEGSEGKLGDETLVCEGEVEKKLWALEKERLVMDVETLHRENEALKRDLVVTCKKQDALREENSKLLKEIKTAKMACKADVKATPHRFPLEKTFLEDRITHLTYKCLRTESHRKALAWQKNYLLKNLQDCHRLEEPWKRPARQSRKLSRRKPAGRFKIVAIAVVAISRMRYIVKRWRPSASVPDLESLRVEPKANTPASVLNIYNEPVNPLSYQTQNIFQPSPSSQILRTPPSRDPGPLALTSECKCSP